MLEVKLLGQFNVQQDGIPVLVPSRAAQSLFAYLVLTPGIPHRREKLAGLLWPDTTEESARKNLRHELWRLRKAIETKVPFFLVDEISIAFDAQSDYWSDVAVMQQPLEKTTSADRLIETLSLYRSELLPGLYDDWVLLERERVRAVFEQKMARLLDLLIAGKRWQEVLDWGERWIAFGQTPEQAYRALMVGHGALGNAAQVASVYTRCVQVLRDDLGVEPSEQTRALFEQLSHNVQPELSGSRADGPPVALARTESAAIRSAVSTTPLSRVSNLPVPLTTFVGREKELTEIAELAESSRLLTLTGPGGVGKTRCVIQASQGLIKLFKDGVWWVDLASVTEGMWVMQSVAQVLGIRESSDRSLAEVLENFLRQKQLLLVLNNCEHLITACAQLADVLLTRCPNLGILATSREPLGITGEQVYQIPSLSLPQPARPAWSDSLLDYEGIRLFVERASAVKPDFTLTEQNAAGVLEICRRLDGIPLALELAAARTRLLSVEQIAQRLNDRFHLLTQGSRTALPRHQTLRATIDWSYALLSEETRLLFRRLSVFAGGFTLEAVEGICSAEPLSSRDLLDPLMRLVDRSLVTVERQGENIRYRLLETIREYTCEKLEEAGETETLRRRHRDFFVAFAERAEPKLKGAQQSEWLDRLDLEHDNWRVAWDCAIETDPGSSLRLASALLDFWFMRGNPSEGREWLSKLVKRTDEWGQTARRAHVLAAAGRLAYMQRDFASARSLLEQALVVARNSGDHKEIGFALLWLGWTAHRQRDEEPAQTFTEECLAIYQELQDEWGVAMATYQLAGLAAARGHYAEAEERYATSLAKFQELGDKFRVGYVLNGSGELARLLGDYERAGKFYAELVRLVREQRSPVAMITTPLVNLAWVSLHAGDYRQAQTLFEESLRLSHENGYKTVLADCLAGFAGILATTSRPGPAARLFGAVEFLLESIGMAGRMDPADQKEFNHYVEVARQQLDSATFAQAWAEGRSMTIEQAVACALEDRLNN